MSKSSFFTGQPIFSQLLSLIPKHIVFKVTEIHGGNRYCKKFLVHDHLVSMLFCCFHRCSSLRELVTGLQANMYRLAHLGLKHTMYGVSSTNPSFQNPNPKSAIRIPQ